MDLFLTPKDFLASSLADKFSVGLKRLMLIEFCKTLIEHFKPSLISSLAKDFEGLRIKSERL